VVNPDILGSMEFATALSGAMLVVVMGHTGCGAVKGAIAGAKLGNLTGLLARLEPRWPRQRSMARSRPTTWRMSMRSRERMQS
jgi:carbonic anhydrase